jgi:hypothetical protein
MLVATVRHVCGVLSDNVLFVKRVPLVLWALKFCLASNTCCLAAGL